MEINETNLQRAYNVADEKGKEMLCALFPEMVWIKDTIDKRPVTERIKTFDDACDELGDNHPFVLSYKKYTKDSIGVELGVVDFLMFRIICAALNEGHEHLMLTAEKSLSIQKYPNRGDIYYYIVFSADAIVRVIKETWDDTEVDRKLFRRGNFFKKIDDAVHVGELLGKSFDKYLMIVKTKDNGKEI